MSDVPASQLDYDLDDVVAADTPTRLKALGHPLRQLLVDLVLERAMTVTELAELSGKAKGRKGFAGMAGIIPPRASDPVSPARPAGACAAAAAR